MVLSLLLGWPLGASVGILGGNLLFSKVVKPTPEPFLARCDQRADDDPSVPFPDTAGKRVGGLQKMLLGLTSPWLTQPDFERATFINSILEILWPHLSPGVHKEVTRQLEAMLPDLLKQVPGGLLADVRLDRLDLGTRPPRIDSFKAHSTKEDELVLEAPLFWGGDLRVRAVAVLRLPGLGARVDVPLDVAGVQLKALARVTVKPLVETLPCVGGVTVSLLEDPWFDAEVRLADSPDLLALPGVPLVMRAAMKFAAAPLVVHPNEITVPLMDGFGLPPPPAGMLRVRVRRAAGLRSAWYDKADPYCEAEVREGRPRATRVVPNNEAPAWDEEMFFVVDDPATQSLKLRVYDDDVLSPDELGDVEVPLGSCAAVAAPNAEHELELALLEPVATQGALEKRLAKAGAKAGAAAAAAGAAAGSAAKPPKRGLLGRLGRGGGAKGTDTGASPGAAAMDAAMDAALAAPTAAEAAAAGEDDDDDGGEAAGGSPPPPPPAGRRGKAKKSKKGARPRVPSGATLFVAVTYMPFESASAPPAPAPGSGPSLAPEAAAAAAAAAKAAAPPPRRAVSIRRTLQSAPSLADAARARGVLTLALKKATHLAAEADTYCVAALHDPHAPDGAPEHEYRTGVELNESSPRFNFRCDFVNVSAASTLVVSLYEQPGALAALASLRVPFLQKAKPKLLGKVAVPAATVARAGRLRDAFPLQDAQTGDLHLAVEWAAVALPDGDGDDE